MVLGNGTLPSHIAAISISIFPDFDSEALLSTDGLTCACAATGHTTSWTLYAISQDADVEAKITEELASLGLLATPERPKPRPLEWEDLSKLVYLNAVIKVLDP